MTDGQRSQRAAWRAAGLCSLCGAATVPGRSLCERHLMVQREYAREKYRARAEAGKCVRPACDKPRWGHHTRCREHHLEVLEYYRRKRAKKRPDTFSS